MRVIIFTILIFNFIAGCNFPGEVNGDKDDVSRGPFDVAYSVLETGDGYIFAGRTWEKGYNIWVVKIDKQGNILSQNTYGEAQKDEVAYTMDRAADGGYILAGYSKLWSSFNMNSYILKIKADGQKEWEIESSGFVHSEIKNVKATLDGGFVAVGYTTDENIKKKIYVAKFSSNGVKQWERSYYSSHGDAVEGNWIEETGDGGYIVVGAAISLGGLFRHQMSSEYSMPHPLEFQFHPTLYPKLFHHFDRALKYTNPSSGGTNPLMKSQHLQQYNPHHQTHYYHPHSIAKK